MSPTDLSTAQYNPSSNEARITYDTPATSRAERVVGGFPNTFIPHARNILVVWAFHLRYARLSRDISCAASYGRGGRIRVMALTPVGGRISEMEPGDWGPLGT